MTDRAEKNAACSPLSFPGYGHHTDCNPRSILTAKGCRGKHLVQWIGVHIVLFSNYLKVLQSSSDRVIVFDDVHFVFNHVAGMRNELATDHPLVFRVIAECIAHAAMLARDTHATFDRFLQPMLLLPGNLTHSPDRDNVVQVMLLILIDV